MQKLAEICIRRPVFATMLVASLVLVGAVCFFTLGVDRFPEVEVPYVMIRVQNPGASPVEIEQEITDRVEAAVNTVSGIDELRSLSSEGISVVTVGFVLSKNGDQAAQEIRQKVDLIRGDLPRTAEAPIVEKFNTGAAPVLTYALVAPGRPAVELTEIADKLLVRNLQNVAGVGQVRISGGRKRQIQVQLDPFKLDSLRLSTAEVARALREQNVELPGGGLELGPRQLTLRTPGRVGSLDALEQISVATRQGQTLRLGDVATVSDGGEEPVSTALLDGQPAVVVEVLKQSGANAVATIDGVKERLRELEPVLPRDVRITLMRDQGEFIRNALSAIEEHLVLGGFLAALVVFAFLRNWRSTLIAAVAIPASTIAAFALMGALGYTLNLMTMLALTLMVGIVIDDAIVVLENIVHVMEQRGLSPWEAAIEGTREIGLAVMATTLSLLAVFVPIGFLGGIVGRFMSSFGFTSAAAIAVSLLVSFTLTPMLAARFLKPPAARASSSAAEPSGWLDRGYTRLLEWAMAHRAVMVALCTVVVLSSAFIPVGASFIPADDDNEFEVVVRAPEGTSLVATQTLLNDIARRIRASLGDQVVAHTLAITAYNQDRAANKGSVFFRLTPAETRAQEQSALMMEARGLLARSMPKDVVTAVQSVDPFAGGERAAAIMYVVTGKELGELDRISARIVEHLKKNPKLVDVDRSLVYGKPELRLEIDRARAAERGVSVGEVSSTINTFVAGEKAGTFQRGQNQFDILLRGAPQFRRDPEALLKLGVPLPGGGLVEVGNLARLEPGTGPGAIDRLARQRQVTIYANTTPGTSESEILEDLEAFVRTLELPPGYRPMVTGNSKELQRTGYYFLLATGLSFAFMYIVLAAQFESFLHPVTILLTLPMSVPFGLLSTWLANEPLNIFSALGILLLFGVVKKNAILQIDHTNHLRSLGMARYEAIILANRHRLRPILMTTIALVAGMLPLLFGKGPGARTNFSIAILVVGGQTLCLLLTLLAVPVFYSLFEDLKAWRPWRQWRPAAEPSA